MFLDPMYFVIVGPAILMALWAQASVKSAFSKGSQYRPSSGLSGAEVDGRTIVVDVATDRR